MIDLLALLICVLGALIYLLAKDAKRAELGRDMFWCGLLVFLAKFGGAIYPLVKG